MNKEKINSLFQDYYILKQKSEKLAELSGDNFNIFNILGLSTSEVRTHSAFLAELLNPYGSHGKGDSFLKLFVEKIGFNDFDTKSANVMVEWHIGTISEDHTEGGNIDLLIYDKSKNSIIIENKIHAEDQKKQLERYYNFGEKEFTIGNDQKFRLYYLTLDGKKASDDSKGKLTEDDYEKISYNKLILNWLNSCLKVVDNIPIIKQTIHQYIILIKQLTHNTIDYNMKKEFENLLKDNPEFVDLAPEIGIIAQKYKEETSAAILNNLNSIFTERIRFDNEIDVVGNISSDDEYGFCFNFFAKKGNETMDGNNKVFNNLREKYKAKLFDTRGEPICWKQLNDYPNDITLMRLPMKELLNLNSENSVEFNNIVDELKGYFNEFKELLKTTNIEE